MKDTLAKTLITGANGMVGSYVDFGIKTDKRSLDIVDLEETMCVVRQCHPKIIIHLAAETDVDRCERDPSFAYTVNSIGTYNVALAAKEVNAKLVYVSTAGIFDGQKKQPYTESDLPNPQNYYGHSKYLGEIIVQKILDDYVIARAGWMFGGGPNKDQKFVAKIITQLKDNATINALNDVRGSPTFGKDLINAIRQLILEEKRGVFNLANSGSCTRYDMAKAVAEILKPKATIIPVTYEYFNLDAKRGKNESMVSSVNLMRPWREALTDYLNYEYKL